MPPVGPNEGTLRFDEYELNLRAGELRKSGRKIRLQEQPFRILAILLGKPREAVTREELREQLWPADTFVDFDHSLNTAVKKLRQALNDEAEKPRYIETLPKRGYRFIGPSVEFVEAVPPPRQNEPPAAASSSATPPSPTVEALPSANRWRIAVPFALVLAAVAIGAFFLFHHSRALTEKDSIVLADFDNTTGDAVFDVTLRQGLAVQLEQSPFISLVSDDLIRKTLRLMAQPDDVHLTGKLAREVCQRANATVEIDGSIARLADNYVVGLKAVNCQSGDTLAQEQITSEDKGHVLAALGKAAKELRRKLGESHSTIQKFDAPIEQATTPSLEALKAYSVAVKTSHEKSALAAVPFFNRAIELDPSFALAYATLGYTYLSLGEPGPSADNFQKAYDLRERVSDREKFHITAGFYSGVTGELEKADQTCELWARAYPRDHLPHLILAFDYELLGRYEKAIAENLDALRLNPDVALLYSNLMEDYTPVNRLKEAKETYSRALDRKLDGPYLHADLYVIAFLENDAAEMQRQISLASDTPGAEDWLFSLQSDTAAYSGDIVNARNFSRLAVESARRNDLKEVAAIWRMNAALREVEIGNVREAREDVKEGLALAASRDTLTLAALVLARAGDTPQAQSVADDLAKRFPLNTQLNGYWLPSIRAAIELDRGNPNEAVRLLQATAPLELGYPQPQIEGGSLVLPAYLRGQAYLQLHQGKEATAEFQKIQDNRAAVVNGPLGALAHLWLGRAYALQGDSAKSRAAYNDFFTLWKDADRNIPILHQAQSDFARLQ